MPRVEGGEEKRSFRQRARGHISKYFHTKSTNKEQKENNHSHSPVSIPQRDEAFGPPPGSHRRNLSKSSPQSSVVNGSSSLSEVHSGSYPDPKVDYPDEFKCPILDTLMAEPVIIESGISYERMVIKRYLELGHRQCFKTGVALDSDAVLKNTSLKTAIEHWCDSNGVSRPTPPSPEVAKNAVDRVCRLDTSTSESFGPDAPYTPDSFTGESSTSDSRMPHSENDLRGLQVHENVSGNSASLEDDVGNISQNRQFESRHTWSEGHLKHSLEQLHNSATVSGRHDGFPCDDRPSPSSSSSIGYAHTVTIAASPMISKAESVESSRSPVPLALTRTPVSFSPEISPSTGSAGSLNADMIQRLASKLQHKHVKEQEDAAMEIRRLSRIGAQNRIELCEPAVLEALLPLLQSRYSQVQINAAAAVMNLSLEKGNKLKVARAGAIPYLVDVLKSGVMDAQEHAAGAIFSLALNDENKMAIGVLGAIPPLIHLLRSSQHAARRDAAMALYHLSFSQMNRSKLIKAGGVGTFLGIARDERSDVVSRALLILCNIAAMQDGRAALAEKDAVPVLVSLLTKGDEDSGGADKSEEHKVNWPEVREHAAAALLQLSQHNFRFRTQATQAGALDGLQRLEAEGTPRAREKAAALLSILREAPRGQKSSLDIPTSLYPRRSYVRPGGDMPKAESAIF
ncbi:vacuolar protein 8 [Marchantia polymorpha subsp. ruderalis]|uniref:RING-type E3 ubiquitin transferase n=2 Tax=Marchantia polymorpha TaxID=3197 RepID=A0AAF6ARE2_MARPO|nr:hypothetical protein MARPO_0001s0138 [Marchantia polymorpha]BBM99012.1 hypothetical protein Mp_1g18000 [Marchantia polymorpha subsp. ruderalis]|eukprot:PTQ50087.1 hypothetical protein MARPO_0001s0138 [Marchantia polymorpha]